MPDRVGQSNVDGKEATLLARTAEETLKKDLHVVSFSELDHETRRRLILEMGGPDIDQAGPR